MPGLLFFLLLVGATSAELPQSWQVGTEYQYAIRGRTLSALQDVADQYSGIVTQALLTIQPQIDGTLEAKVTKALYAQVHTELVAGWDSEIPENMLDFKPLPMSENVFEIKMKHGVVRDLIVEKDVPNWEVNVLKSVVGQLQVDTQGENLMASGYNLEPEAEQVNAVFKTMEDSVGGKCEVLYDISPLPEFILASKPELVPVPEARGDGGIMEIIKTKNFSNCEQRSGYHFGIPGSNSWEPGASDNGNFLSRSSISRIVVTGDLVNFTIQSAVTTNKVIVSPNFHENHKGMVSSRINVTLVKMGPLSSVPWSIPFNPESAGNLVYTYDDPFAGVGEGRPAVPPKDNLNSDEQKLDRYNRYLPEKPEGKQDDGDSGESDSSKSANSLESKEEMWFLQPGPSLNEAPAVPLLPFFIGNRGKSIESAEGFDSVASAKSLSTQIGSDLQNTSSITDERTLEKFSILAKIIRTMNTQQIAEAQSELYPSASEMDPHAESESVRHGTWVAFRDAVAQAGTGPALVTIKTWIKEKKIQGYEAASVVGVMSKTARTPTQEYLDAFFELATMPETTEQQYLNSSALLTFAELVRYSGDHNRHAVHTFGRFAPNVDLAIQRDYLPYMAGELNKSIENNEYAKSHTFITALGYMAHPTILAVFEPYLEGTSPASTFQRLLMVFSINKLAFRNPTLARSIFYRIYQNTGEAHQLRCAAVFSLMITNPPASMLQRMAEFTNEDLNKHVNAAVKSAIKSASKLKTPELRELAKNARNVKPLLNKESSGFEFPENHLSDYMDPEKNLAYRFYSASISSDDSFIPEFNYASLQGIYGGFEVPRMEVGAMVSSVKDVSDVLFSLFETPKNLGQNDKAEFSPRKIAKLLNIEAESEDNLEGLITFRSAYGNKFISFDKQALQRLPQILSEAAADLKDGLDFNTVKIESADVTVSFPMESGFPFVYTLKVPWLLKASGSVEASSSPKSLVGTAELRAVYSMQFQARLGFVTPFEHQHYMAGIDKMYHINIPIRAEFNHEKPESRVTLKLQPMDQNVRQKLIHRSVVPFTSCHDILNMVPIAKDPKTHQLISTEPLKTNTTFGSRTRGLYLEIESEAVSSPKSSTKKSSTKKSKRLAGFVFLFAEEPEYHKTEIFLGPNPSSEQSVVLTGSLETLHDNSVTYDEIRSKVIAAKSPVVTDKTKDSSARRHELLLKASEGIAGADAFAIDFSVELPGLEPLLWFGTVACASSKVDEKSRGLAYWKLSNGAGIFAVEACVGVESTTPKSSNLVNDISSNVTSKTREFDVELRVGATCETGKVIKIAINQEQTKEFKNALKASPSAIECAKALKKGNKAVPACQDLSAKMAMLDVTRLTMKYDKALSPVQQEIDDYVNGIQHVTDNVHSEPKSNVDDSTNSDNVTIIMSLSPDSNTADYFYESDNIGLVAQDVSVGAIGSLVGNVDPDLTALDHLDMALSDDGLRQQMCVLDSNSITTFDDSSYPINLGKCWHVAMTPFPKTIKDSPTTKRINEDMALSILVRDTLDNHMDVKVTLGDNELQLSNNASENSVELNGTKLDLDAKRRYTQKTGDDIDFEVFQRPDGSIGVSSEKYEVDVTFDGQSLRIKASDKYRGDVRGLCGNFDSEPANDFTSPKDCVLARPEEFAASYALLLPDCQGPARILAGKADKAVCIEKSTSPGNVISDGEAGRKKSKKSDWGFHKKPKISKERASKDSGKRGNCAIVRTQVIDEDDQMCFSQKPLPVCISGCQPVRIKTKMMPVYCVPKSVSAQQLADRIEQGANPDLSQKAPSKKSAFELPVGCHVA